MSKQNPLVFSAILGVVLLNWVGFHQASFALPDSTGASFIVSQRSILDSIMSRFRGRTPGIRRNVNSLSFCPINPGVEGKDQIWSDRPVFMWEGNIKQVILRPFASEEELWSQSVGSTEQQVEYGGPALEPGVLYEWAVVGWNGQEDETSHPHHFEVIGGEQRQQIDSGLQQLASQISNKTAEEQALDRIAFFAERNLWSDAFQIFYSIDHPSTEMKAAMQEIIETMCPPESAG